ncbi:MAG: MBL fold metallo-hydrolase [Spirosomataceae bacterium]
MKRFLKFFGWLFVIAVIGVIVVLFVTEPRPAMIVSYASNPDLQTIRPASQWKGTPVDAQGRFVNHEYPFLPEFSKLWAWQTERNPQKEEKKTDRFRLKVHTDSSFLHSSDDCIVWLGHASYFIRLNGQTLLIDPVLGDVGRFVKRLSDLPVSPHSFKQLDYILLSHDHRDHADEYSMKLLSNNNPHTTYLTSLRLDGLLRQWTASSRIQTAGWYQQYQTDTSQIKIYFLPTRHWCRRGLTDTNQMLWGAFVLQANGKTIYFGGDTGYGSHLKEVKELFGTIDYYLVGVGAYKPEWFMGGSHMSPQSAVKAANEMDVKMMIPMHYGTFDLSDEPIGDPYRSLQQLQQKGAIQGQLKLLEVGEILRI